MQGYLTTTPIPPAPPPLAPVFSCRAAWFPVSALGCCWVTCTGSSGTQAQRGRVAECFDPQRKCTSSSLHGIRSQCCSFGCAARDEATRRPWVLFLWRSPVTLSARGLASRWSRWFPFCCGLPDCGLSRWSRIRCPVVSASVSPGCGHLGRSCCVGIGWLVDWAAAEPGACWVWLLGLRGG